MRPRKRGNRDLPPGLYAEKKAGKIYYSYLHPGTGKRHGMGANRTEAVVAAKQLNAILINQVSLADRVLGRTDTVSTWLDKYLAMRLSEGNISEQTIRLLKYDIELMRKDLGEIIFTDLSVFHCAEFLEQWSLNDKKRMASRMRSQLIKCLDYAVSAGMIEDNPAKKTLPIEAKVTRQRLTLEAFKAIYEEAPTPIRNAMNLGLITLQRRRDIASMMFKDIQNGYLKVKQSKTFKGRGRRKNSENPSAHLMIEVSQALKSAISECRSTGVVSHYMIHHIHGRKSAGATHKIVQPGMPLQPDNISRGFASARDRTGLFNHLKKEEKPTFHEIRALGAKLYRDAGIDPQALLGHSDPKATKIYLDGHGTEWTQVKADLSF